MINNATDIMQSIAKSETVFAGIKFIKIVIVKFKKIKIFFVNFLFLTCFFIVKG